MPASPDLEARLRRRIERGGAMPLAEYMALANQHYYATRDPLGAAGDFTTAPEISQMFGELIGLCLADLWLRAGRPTLAYVELGPGRGTLAEDALRAMARAGLAPDIHLVETSPVLREAQSRRLPLARHHDTLATLPADRPLLVVANEFFDALPIRQIVRGDRDWRERMVGLVDGRFAPGLGAQRFDAALPSFAAGAAPGATIETSPASVAVMGELAGRLARQGGAALVIDYGYAAPGLGDTLQAVRAHRFADPFEAPGTCDLTAHVDFQALAEAATRAGAVAYPLRDQGAWLEALGIAARAAALARAAPARADEIAAARRRLVDAAEMGTLFKLLRLSAPDWPVPAG
ncbi:class I SAM-dependent methyltransferase [Sphingomonas morindae]|uniref:SAM-dependent methyltransferase n=1 Tax=Sphingomonas morindae TaxID=1541170 RepID=A0ABY4XAU7_9SPHN|nr:SAM-dependent methyltransferase [Sphingomonas morindae]USI74083.1 SAM-dependent methyltransferase [Sphingomonas morindae]